MRLFNLFFYLFSYYRLGENMRFEILDDKYLYFTSKIYSLENENDISLFLKDVFLNICEIYFVELYGYFKVDIYIDDKIGVFVEIKKLDDYVLYGKKIDTKVSISHNNFYLKTNDLSLIFQYKPIYKNNNYYYVSTKNVDNYLDLMEFLSIEYKDIDLE